MFFFDPKKLAQIAPQALSVRPKISMAIDKLHYQLKPGWLKLDTPSSNCELKDMSPSESANMSLKSTSNLRATAIGW